MVNDKSELVCVIADLGPGGAQRVMSTLVNAWAAEGRRISVITFSNPEDDFFKLAPEVVRVGIGGLAPSGGLLEALRANIGRLRSLRRAMRRSGAPSVLAFLGATNIITIMAAIGLGLRVVISERNDPRHQSLGRVWDSLRRRLYGRAHVVTANSRSAITTMKNFVPKEKLSYISNPVTQADTTVPERRQKRILHIGRLTHQKGQDILLRAFALVVRQAPDWRLTIIGEGEDDAALKYLADELEIAGHVDWLSRIAEPMRHYLDSAIFALPSRFEGTPNVLLEAMSASLPAVVTDGSTGPLDYVEDGKTGLVVPAEDVSALAEALLRLISDCGLRTIIGEAARVRVSGENLTSVLRDWDEILQLSPTATYA